MGNHWRFCDYLQLYASRFFLESTRQGFVRSVVQRIRLGIRGHWDRLRRDRTLTTSADDIDSADVHSKQDPLVRDLPPWELVFLPLLVTQLFRVLTALSVVITNIVGLIFVSKFVGTYGKLVG